MDENKIAFIFCTNDEIFYNESVKFLQAVEIPENMNVEIINVENISGIAEGYNRAMRESEAKYKVYLQENVFVINKRIIFDILEVFVGNKHLGLLGLYGCKKIPTSIQAWSGNHGVLGKLPIGGDGSSKDGAVKEVVRSYEPVEAVGGSLIATQHDMAWRDDLFKGNSLYEVAQSTEFRMAGYDVGVVRQSESWCIHEKWDVRADAASQFEREAFKRTYSNYLFPLVSILIPTYNRPQLFKLALDSVLQQTYTNIEIIVCDDSTNNETEIEIKPYLKQYPSMKYIKNDRNLGQFENDLKCLELANGEYINFLMDDDLFHCEKIEKMMDYFIHDESEELSLVTSYRQLIDMNGNKLRDWKATTRLFNSDTIMDGIEFGEYIIQSCMNYIGEPTTVLFRKTRLTEPFGTLSRRKYICNVDLASWINLLSNGKIVYIAEPLSYFRIHQQQQLHSPKIRIQGGIDFIHQVLCAKEYGYFHKDLFKYKSAIENCLKIIERLFEQFSTMTEVIQQFEELNVWYQKLLNEKSRIVKEFPLVSIVIPAYNRPEYLEQALLSSINQTYPNIEIMICDDSTNSNVYEQIKPLLSNYNHIAYKKNNTPLNRENFVQCHKIANGEYINFLMDDDLFHPEKIEKMMRYFLKYPEVTLVTSDREYIDEAGEILKRNSSQEKLFSQDKLLDGIEFGNLMLKNVNNYIGEPTTALYRKSDLNHYGEYQGKKYNALIDVATWLSLLPKGKVVYIAESLSYFRQHAGQNQNSLEKLPRNIYQWFNLIYDSRTDGFLNKEDDYKSALLSWNKLTHEIIRKVYSGNAAHLLKDSNINQSMLKAAESLTMYEDVHKCNYCGKRFKEYVSWPDKYGKSEHKFEMWNQNSICPVCMSLDRERLFKTYLEQETNLLSSRLQVLHIAPEKNLRRWLSSLAHLNYICGDLYPQDAVTEKIDITETRFKNESFDVVLISHVLEHIPDDIQAMNEIFRILRPNGWGIVQVPIALDILDIYEDFSIVSPEERYKAFGQEDHVRIYSRQGFIKRLESVGFKVELYNHEDKYGDEAIKQMGISNKNSLYIVRKEQH